ncbi:MAG: class I SAM-dependent methyltransferase [Syntrophales bacterium]
MKRFDTRQKESYEDWLRTPAGRYVDNREKKLILDLLAPRGGERILSIESRSENRHLFLKDEGCLVTEFHAGSGMDQQREISFCAGVLEDLPFSDNEFDLVCLISSLEYAGCPEKAVREAARVCRKRVFIGVPNRYSLAGARERMATGFPGANRYSARRFGIIELMRIVKDAFGETRMKWGSVVFFPYTFYSFAGVIEESIPIIRNPFGDFLGLSFSVVSRYRTVQDGIIVPFRLGVKRHREVRGTVREIKPWA